MRTLALLALCACASPSKAPVAPIAPPAPAPVIPPVAVAPAAIQHLDKDTPETTAFGNTFIAPAGFTLEQRGDATIIGTPEPGSYLVLFDVHAADADAAVDAAWHAYKAGPAPWKLLERVAAADKDGWSKRTNYGYDVPPNTRRQIGASAMFANGAWLVIVVDLIGSVAEKRMGQLAVVGSKLLPKGHDRESFAGKAPHDLDDARLAELAKFVTAGEAALRVPGVAYGIVQHGKIVFAGGIGQRDFGKPAKVDADTEFMIASNTKQLTTLMIAKLVDANKLTWETAVTSLLPTFKLGTAEVTKQVLVKHLICACTGLPRQDLEWLLNFKGSTPESMMASLVNVQPTSKFGEMFQYSNLLAAAGGYVGGHVAYPTLELGAAYDKAMQTLVFEPLGMTATTFDYARALRGDHATPHSYAVDGTIAYAPLNMEYSILSARPAGAAWSTVRDLLKYVSMELAKGKLPNGKPYIGEAALLARRAPQVPLGKDATYGMGLMVDHTYGVEVVHHGGDIFGFHSDVIWLPDQDIGAVVLTNGDGGTSIRDRFRRKLLELVFDGNPEADAGIAADGQALLASIETARKLLVIPADPAATSTLAAKYANKGLGTITVSHAGGKTVFDFGPFKSEMASRANPDGTVSLLTIVPGFVGFELVIAGTTLVVRDAQHEYIYEPVH